jgi:hypothetical protein
MINGLNFCALYPSRHGAAVDITGVIADARLVPLGAFLRGFWLPSGGVGEQFLGSRRQFCVSATLGTRRHAGGEA